MYLDKSANIFFMFKFFQNFRNYHAAKLNKTYFKGIYVLDNLQGHNLRPNFFIFALKSTNF